MLARLTGFITAVFLFSAIFASQSFAQTPSSSKQVTATTAAIPATVSPTSPLYTDLLLQNMFHTFSCLAIGESLITQPCLTYQITKNAQGTIQSMPVLSKMNLSGGALGATTSLIGMLYQNQPVRTIDYLASIEQGLGIVKTANAQVVGSGAQVLNPILKLWQVSRNISYIFLIIIFLIIGLMIIFRNKINPQAVISAQAALPGLVIGLVMITFSYFFAGLISDMAFIGTNAVGYYFVAAQGKLDTSKMAPDEAKAWTNQQALVQQINAESVLSIFSQFVGIVTQDKAQGALANIYNKFNQDVRERIDWLAGIISYQFIGSPAQQIPVIGQFIGPIIGLVAGISAARDPTAVLGIAIAFVSTFVLIYAMVKLLLRLVNSYLTIVFLTFTAPFQLLIAALPGRQGIATNWILNILANVLVFPAVLAVFYFVAFLLGQSFGPLTVAKLQEKPDTLMPTVYAADNNIIDTQTFPLFGAMDLGFINILLAFGVLVALPSIPDIVVKSIGKMGQAGQLIGQEISGNIRSGQGYAGRVPSGAAQVAQGVGTSIYGESQYFIDDGKVKRFTTKPGFYQFFKSRGGGTKPTGGAARNTGP